MVPNWVYGAMIAVSLLHLVALYRLRASRGQPPRAGPVGERGDGDRVECPECGAKNERGYRFCRACVSELPGGTARARRASGIRSGRLS